MPQISSIKFYKKVITKKSKANKPIEQINQPRAGWRVAFEKMAHAGDDELLDKDMKHPWDKEEWEW